MGPSLLSISLNSWGRFPLIFSARRCEEFLRGMPASLKSFSCRSWGRSKKISFKRSPLRSILSKSLSIFSLRSLLPIQFSCHTYSRNDCWIYSRLRASLGSGCSDYLDLPPFYKSLLNQISRSALDTSFRFDTHLHPRLVRCIMPLNRSWIIKWLSS